MREILFRGKAICGSLCTLYEKKIEVVGNIHDNPELFGGTKNDK